MPEPEITPAARKWLWRAYATDTIWPTFGPWEQLTKAGLLEGPQEAARITPSGCVYVEMFDA